MDKLNYAIKNRRKKQPYGMILF